VQVREVAGVSGTLSHVVPTVWKADAQTICILLDNPRTGRWLVITLDLVEPIVQVHAAERTEVA
jgi:hypothetical protein